MSPIWKSAFLIAPRHGSPGSVDLFLFDVDPGDMTDGRREVERQLSRPASHIQQMCAGRQVGLQEVGIHLTLPFGRPATCTRQLTPSLRRWSRSYSLGRYVSCIISSMLDPPSSMGSTYRRCQAILLR